MPCPAASARLRSTRWPRADRLGGPGTLVVFSSGSLLNLAQGRFGPHPVNTVRFIATPGTDYGVIAVQPVHGAGPGAAHLAAVVR